MSVWYKDSRGFTRDQNGGAFLAVQSDGSGGYGAAIGVYTTPSRYPSDGILWVRNGTGKRFVKVTQPDPGAGPFNIGHQPHFNVVVTGLTTAAGGVSSAITVNNSSVTSNSRILAIVIEYGGTYGTNGIPIVALGAIVDQTSFQFQVCNVHGSNALSGSIKIAFTIEN